MEAVVRGLSNRGFAEIDVDEFEKNTAKLIITVYLNEHRDCEILWTDEFADNVGDEKISLDKVIRRVDELTKIYG